MIAPEWYFYVDVSLLVVLVTCSLVNTIITIRRWNKDYKKKRPNPNNIYRL